jgi:acetate kinase
MIVLVFNTGSASLKFDLVRVERRQASPHDGKKLLSGIIESIGREAVLSEFNGKNVSNQHRVEAKGIQDAVERAVEWMKQERPQDVASVEIIGHRVVHGADRFSGPVWIDDGTVQAITELEDIAPLHNRPALEAIEASQKLFGPKSRMAAVFDTSFHRTLPERAFTYALPYELAERRKIRRYGFHGPSHEYMMRRYAEIAGKSVEDVSIVTLHLESGCSACAIQNGRSVDTSMGFTPLEGLVMGMRSGDLDPALVGYIARNEQLSLDQVEELLNKKSGLLGLSGVSHDTRKLMEQIESNDRAKLAMEVFCYRAAKYIGAYLAALGGAEVIIFGGGIGEDTPWVRARVCASFDWCGLMTDQDANAKIINQEGRISTDGSKLQAWVIPTEESLMIAHQAALLRA